MTSKKVLFIGATAAAMTAAIAAPSAFADPDPVELNGAATAIPFQQIVSAGSSVDMTDITYTMTVAPVTYNNDAPTGAYTYAGTISNQPIVVVPAGTSTSGATTATNGNTSTWDYTRTLAELFGNDAATNFPQAGMYEFSIAEAVTGGSSADTTKWTYDNPTYKLQVLIENTTENGEITGRHYAGWTLLELDSSTGQYSKVNSGATGSDGKAVFESDYSGTAQLNVSKVVSGDYASTTYAFPIQVTLFLPSYAADASITATDPANQAITATSGANTTTRVYDVSLKHGETATFTVPVGTTYQIVEDPNNTDILDAGGISYDPEIEWVVDNGVSGPALPSSLSTASLSELTALSASLRSGDVLPADVSSLIGDTVTVTLANNSTKTARLVDANANKGLVFMFTAPLTTLSHFSSESGAGNNGWNASSIRAALNRGTLYTSRLRDMKINSTNVTPTKVTNISLSLSYNDDSPQSQSTDENNNGPADDGDMFWLPSYVEMFGTWTNYEPENSQFAYYSHLGVSASNYSALASSDWWWLRSASPTYTTDFMCVNANGLPTIRHASYTGGVAPCFCL